MNKSEISKEALSIMKSLGINTRGLIAYSRLYNTSPSTFTRKGCSAWLYTVNTNIGTIEMNTKYLGDIPENVQKHNEKAWANHWTERFKKHYNNDFSGMNRYEIRSWIEVGEKYGLVPTNPM